MIVLANLSKLRREKMLELLEMLKKEHEDDSIVPIISEIENELQNMKYGLVWEEHSERVDEEMVDNIPVFQEVEERKIQALDENEYNFLLEGDNLHSLKLLEKTHREKIDVIYIDPPYNTGNKDFVYDDNFVENDDGYRHSKWLSFMEKRLIIARDLLTDKGFIMISIDESESAQLRLLCDHIFGEDNFQTTLHIQVRYAQKSLTEDKAFLPVIEYVYIYSKDKTQFKPKLKEVPYTNEKFRYTITELKKGHDITINGKEVTVFKKGEWEIKESKEGFRQGLKETWISGTIYTKMSYGKVFQEVVEPRVEIDGLGCLYKVHGRGEDGLGYRYYTGPKRQNAKRGKMYSGMPLVRVAEIKENGQAIRFVPMGTFYDYAADFGNITHEGGITFNSGKKPTKLLKNLIDMSRYNDSVVLDFFAGSGSTAHAAMQLNKDDGGNRKYILCTNNENNICEEVTYQRLQNIQEELPHNLKYFKTDFIPKLSQDEELISDRLLAHIKEMVELENMCEIDGEEHIVILSDEDLDNIDFEGLQDGITLYIPSYVLLSRSQENLIKNKDITIVDIPDYYFVEELREAGEL